MLLQSAVSCLQLSLQPILHPRALFYTPEREFGMDPSPNLLGWEEGERGAVWAGGSLSWGLTDLSSVFCAALCSCLCSAPQQDFLPLRNVLMILFSDFLRNLPLISGIQGIASA